METVNGHKVQCTISGQVAAVVKTQNGHLVEIKTPAADEFSYPSVYPIYFKGKPPVVGHHHECTCDVVSFGRKALDKEGNKVTYRDLKLFAV